MSGKPSALLKISASGVEYSVLVLGDADRFAGLMRPSFASLDSYGPGSGEFEYAMVELFPIFFEGNADLRQALSRLSAENVQLYENLKATQTRSTELILKARDWRRKIVELGGEDPGPP